MQYLDIPSPCFVLEKNLLIKNLEVFKNVQKASGVWALCALKGFSFYREFDLLNSSIKGATASSLHEVLLASAYFNDVHACFPVYKSDEFEQVTSLCSHITFNTISQFKRYKHALVENNTALLRINPEYSEVEIPLYNPARTNSRLGVSRKELSTQGGLPEEIEGLHVHALCENDSFTFDRLFKKIEENFADELNQVKYLNIGGGHLITKKGYDLDHFTKTILSISSKYNVQVIMEPGSAFGWQAGFLKTSVQDVIKKEDHYILMLDASFSAHMPDTLEMPYMPEVRGFNKVSGLYSITFGGNTCLAGDEMSGYFSDTLPRVGDEIIFEDMMHYTTVKTTTFNGVKHPAIGRIGVNQEFELLSQPGYEDYIAHL